MESVVAWLLEGPPWVEYRARVDLLAQSPDHPDVVKAKRALLRSPEVKDLLDELKQWPGAILNSHKASGHPIHKLTFLADLGLVIDDPGIRQIAGKVMAHRSADGPFQVLMNISPSYGGTGMDQWAWALCDAPLLLYALIQFGLGDDPRVQQALEHLAGLVRENGWPCAVSGELGKFRGPGRKEDPCPYANLAMLKALALTERHESEACESAVEAQLALWKKRKDRHPYMFYMGTDFTKLKAPLVWYDLLHMLDVLSRFPWVFRDARFDSMVRQLGSHADKSGRFTAQSVWKPWSTWEFGQKTEPSRWVTLLATRVLKRAPEGRAGGA
jgi:hypothetical protein